jgi:hypothetical protein
MLNFQTIQLMHRHDDDRSAPMNEINAHDPAAQDEERDWLRGARIFRCTECKEEVVVGPPEAKGHAAGGAA